MNKDEYLKKLENSILKAGYDEYYVAKCLRYATRLIDNNLPVIFDIKHFALLIGIAVSDLSKILFVILVKIFIFNAYKLWENE